MNKEIRPYVKHGKWTAIFVIVLVLGLTVYSNIIHASVAQLGRAAGF